MTQAANHTFEHIPHTVRGHFVIYLYAAIYRLLNHIHRLSDVGGTKLEQVFEHYPFLNQYFAEMCQYMPEEITWEDGINWWQQEIAAWEAGCDGHLPLLALAQDAGLDWSSRLALMVTVLVEEDSRFGTLFAELQAPLGHRRPTLELVGQIMKTDEAMMGERDAWTLCRPLLTAGFIETLNRQAPRSEWILQTPSLLWDAIRGQIAERPAPGCRYDKPQTFSAIDALILPPTFLQQLERIPAMLAGGQVRTLVLRSDPGADPIEVLGAVAKHLGRSLLSLEDAASLDGEQWQAIGPLCTMTRALPALSYDLAPGETAELPALIGYNGPIGLILGHEGGLGRRTSGQTLTLTLPAPDAALRKRHWQQVFNGRRVDDLDAITGLFHFSGGYIRQVAEIAIAHAKLDGRETIKMADVHSASHSLNHQLLDTLADRLETQGSWHDLVATETTITKLSELARRCRHRERLLEYLGPAFYSNKNRGVRALFTGVSGTGKTLAAKILAAELGMDLYRVDLAAVINKYIGETEKNLHHVLSRAEALDVILLLDEGDALLGNRTEVKSANDRYANLETNYLLQRLEYYQGIILVTTNLGDNIDSAFQRRMDVVVPFFPPQAEERLSILQRHLPLENAVDLAYLEQIAWRCALTGGQIRNVALHAVMLALDEDSLVKRHHMETALRSEYRKAGGTFPLSNGDFNNNRYNRMDTFVAALREN